MKDHIKSVLIGACVVYTVMVFFFSLTVAVAYSAAPEGANVSAGRILLALPCALMIGIARRVRTAGKPGTSGRWIWHALLCIGGAFFFLILPAVSDRPGSEKLTGFVVCLAVYFIAVPLTALFSSRIRKAAQRDRELRR